MSSTDEPTPDRITARDPNAAACTAVPGMEHDYRPHTYVENNVERTSLRCVWCHVLACGDYGQADPCIEPYHHQGNHRTAAGKTWPLGGDRP